MRAAPDPRILTGWSGASPHVLRFPPRAFLRFPVCPPGSSPSPAFLWFPFVRRSPVRPLRPLPGSGSPSGVPPGSLPLSNLHDSAAAARFRRRWSRAARAKVTSPAATPRLDLAVIRPALKMGSGRARWDAAAESPVTSGRERRTAGPEPPRSPVIGRDPSSRVDHVMTSPSGGSPMRCSPGVRAPSHELAPETPICADEGCRRGPGRRRCALRSSPCSGAYCAATWPSPG